MRRHFIAAAASALLIGTAWADGDKDHRKQAAPEPGTGGSGEQVATAPAQQDLWKYGPWTRKATNEKQTRKEVEQFLREDHELWKKGDLEGSLARIDFPVLMITDDSKGATMAMSLSRDQYSRMMKPMMEQQPKDLKFKHDLEIEVLSDSLASFTNDFTLTTGKEKRSGRSNGVLVKKDGQWKWKMMVEAGWGDMPQQGVGGSGEVETDPVPPPEGSSGIGGSGQEPLPPPDDFEPKDAEQSDPEQYRPPPME